MESIENVDRLINLCDDLMASNILFADKKVDKILELIASTPELYELISDCLNEFDKESEYKKAFSLNDRGEGTFVMPKEEFKILALVFCLMADVGTGKIKLDEIAEKYFKNKEGKIDTDAFMKTIFEPFKELIAEAFGSYADENLPLTQEQLDTLTPEERLKILPFPIQRSSYFLINPERAYDTFIAAKETALQMIERLEEEKMTPVVDDVLMMLHCVIIAAIEKDFDLLEGLVRGLKYACRSLKPMRHYVKELIDIVETQVLRESK